MRKFLLFVSTAVLALGIGLGTTCGTGKSHSADNGILGVHQLETIEVEVTDLESLAKTEMIDIDDNALRDLGIYSLNLDLLHGEVELTTGLHTLGVTLELDRHLDGDGLLVVYLEKVHVEDGILDGMELDVLEDCHTGLTVYSKLDGEDIGGVDELADSILANHEVCSDKTLAIADLHDFLAGLEGGGIGEVDDGTAIENDGDFVFLAEILGCLLAQIGTGLGAQLKCLHFLILFRGCVTQN